MKWLEEMFRTSYVTHKGFLKRQGISMMEPATLRLYSNGLCVVEWNGNYYSTTKRNETQYSLDGRNAEDFTQFLVSE